MEHKSIIVRGAREHNLKNINVDIPKNALVVITGPSGSGKSTLAFDTIYAEGQRRYVESLSAYARQFLGIMKKPDVDSISGLSPAIAIEQKTTSNNPRSTVGTITEIYDYMRLLYARAGTAYSPVTGNPIEAQTVRQMVDITMKLPEGTKIYLLAPVISRQKGEFKGYLAQLQKQGFSRAKIDGQVYEIDEAPKLLKTHFHDISVIVDRLVIKHGDETLQSRIAQSFESAIELTNGLAQVERLDIPEKDDDQDTNDSDNNSDPQPKRIISFSANSACLESGFTLPPIEPRLFSFNSPIGACDSCSGLGTLTTFTQESVVPDQNLSISQGAIPALHSGARNTLYYLGILDSVLRHYNEDIYTPYKCLSEQSRKVLMHGSGKVNIEIVAETTTGRTYQSCKPFIGVLKMLHAKIHNGDTSDRFRKQFSTYQVKENCTDCHGFRLSKAALCVKIGEKHIGQTGDIALGDLALWMDKVESYLDPVKREIAIRVVKEIKDRLKFLIDVGLGYLTLGRAAGTLSGGEAQRIRLASQIGSGLTGVLYVLDEPSIGLHQRDNNRLLETLKTLRDLGNCVLVVEHDEDAMRCADYIVDIGPKAGINGGNVVAAGDYAHIIACPESITGQYLSGKKSIAIPEKRRSYHLNLVVRGARANNLRNVDVVIPLRSLVCVTGVSGSGKSSLVFGSLLKYIKAVCKRGGMSAALQFDDGDESNNNKGNNNVGCRMVEGLESILKVIDIDQSPIGRTPRSNPATYIDLFGLIRDWYAMQSESKARGYGPGRFSFNVKGGRCENCQGDGVIKVEMHFLPDVYVTCDECNGRRYNRETLEITYKDKTIADVLNMTVAQAIVFFSQIPLIHAKLELLMKVGLDYIKLGQSSVTLSGGEAQRIKLAKELSKRNNTSTLYILDEPTTGLHFQDIQLLIDVLQSLVDRGNSVLIIEHNLDVIKIADHVIDIGPEGGVKGGMVVAQGTPEEVAQCEKSHTGRYLRSYLNMDKAQ